MALADELREEVKGIFATSWSSRDGTVVPTTDNVKLGNDAVELDGTVLYADLVGSTKLVDTYKAPFAAEVYKTYLACAARIIRNEGGEITAYDGDRVMALFIGDPKNTPAVRCALRLNWAVQEIINPALKAQYPKSDYQVRQTVGIDTSKLFIARTGIRGANDLVWVGRAANYAAKLCSLRDGVHQTWITADVYDHMRDEAKSADGKSMWEKREWKDKGNMTIYCSSWWWSLP